MLNSLELLQNTFGFALLEFLVPALPLWTIFLAATVWGVWGYLDSRWCCFRCFPVSLNDDCSALSLYPYTACPMQSRVLKVILICPPQMVCVLPLLTSSSSEDFIQKKKKKMWSLGFLRLRASSHFYNFLGECFNVLWKLCGCAMRLEEPLGHIIGYMFYHLVDQMSTNIILECQVSSSGCPSEIT